MSAYIPFMTEQGKLKLELRRILGALARDGATITYRELALLADIPPPQAIHRLTSLLEEMIREDVAAERPLLAALAVSRCPQAIPQRGFFHLLRELGRYEGPDEGPAAAAAHREELELAWAYWGAYSAA